MFSYPRAEKVFERHYKFSIGRTTIQRTTQRIGKRAEVFLEEKLNVEKTPHKAQSCPYLWVELDGAMIRTGKLTSAKQAGYTALQGYRPGDKVRNEEWKEVRTGLVQLPGESKPYYISGHRDYSKICHQMTGLSALKGRQKNTKIIAVSDGGNGLRAGLENAFGDLVFVLDYAHVKKHFRETAEALGIEKAMRKGWIKSFTKTLWETDEESVSKVMARLTSLLSDKFNERLSHLIGYLTRFEDAIHYGKFKQRGWPTGSGKIESAHRHVVQERLKIPGACWRIESINPMMALRNTKQNEWWTDFCAVYG